MTSLSTTSTSPLRDVEPPNQPKPSEPSCAVDIDFRLLRPTEVAGLLGLSRSKVYTLIDDGHLRALKIGRSTRIPLRSVYDFIQGLGSSHAVAQPCVILDDVEGPS